jgi:hypothetical protein
MTAVSIADPCCMMLIKSQSRQRCHPFTGRHRFATSATLRQTEVPAETRRRSAKRPENRLHCLAGLEHQTRLGHASSSQFRMGLVQLEPTTKQLSTTNLTSTDMPDTMRRCQGPGDPALTTSAVLLLS